MAGNVGGRCSYPRAYRPRRDERRYSPAARASTSPRSDSGVEGRSDPGPGRSGPAPATARTDGRHGTRWGRPPGRSLAGRPEPARARAPSRRAGDAIGSGGPDQVRGRRIPFGSLEPPTGRPALVYAWRVGPDLTNRCRRIGPNAATVAGAAGSVDRYPLIIPAFRPPARHPPRARAGDVGPVPIGRRGETARRGRTETDAAPGPSVRRAEDAPAGQGRPSGRRRAGRTAGAVGRKRR